MTTDNSFEVALNVFVKNDVFNIAPTPQQANFPLSAALRLYDTFPLIECHTKAMEELHRRIIEYFPTYTVWLLVSNGGKVPENRIVQYYRLWRALEKNSIPLPKGERTSEFSIRDAEGIQYFGAICLNNLCFSELSHLMSLRSSIHLVISPSDETVLQLLKKGWSYDSRKYPTSILRYIEQESMFFIVPLGAFDDREGGAVALARPSLIEKCFR